VRKRYHIFLILGRLRAITSIHVIGALSELAKKAGAKWYLKQGKLVSE